MARANATVPRWDGEQWTYRPSINGRQRHFTSNKPDKAGYNDCIRQANAVRGGQDGSSVRFEKAWELHLADRLNRFGDGDSYRKTESIGRVHFIPKLKNIRVSKITAQDWQNIIYDIKPTRGGHSAMSKKSLQNIRAEIVTFGRFCEKSKYIEGVWRNIDIPKHAKKIGKQIMPRDALRAFLTDDSDEWYLNLWQLMATTGLRPGEACGLHKADIENGMIQVRRSINKRGEITDGKNENAQRVMIQKPIDQRIIENQLKKHAKLAEEHIVSPWLFCDEYGAKPKPVIIGHHWEEYRKRFPVNITQYGLRHTFVSYSKAVLPEALLKQLVGHSDAMPTLDVYGKKVDGDDRKAAKIVTGVFDEILKVVKK